MPPDKGGGTSCCTLHIGCLLHTLLHTQLHTYTSANLPTTLTELAAEQHTEHICTAFLKTENCQLSRNFQNLHSNTVLVCKNINIWPFKEVICVLVEEIFYEWSCSYVLCNQIPGFQMLCSYVIMTKYSMKGFVRV